MVLSALAACGVSQAGRRRTAGRALLKGAGKGSEGMSGDSRSPGRPVLVMSVSSCSAVSTLTGLSSRRSAARMETAASWLSESW